jgi:hypothetical protein
MKVELSNSLRFSASSLGSLCCSLRVASKLVSQKARLTQTSMPLVLSFAETSSSAESIFAQGISQLLRVGSGWCPWVFSSLRLGPEGRRGVCRYWP